MSDRISPLRQLMLLFHGTQAKPFTQFNTNLTYLTPDERFARLFAQNPHLTGLGEWDRPHVLTVEPKGLTRLSEVPDLSNTMEDLWAEGLGEHEMRDIFNQYRDMGHRYVQFYHYPPFDGRASHDEFSNLGGQAVVSLHPEQDLRIVDDKYRRGGLARMCR